MDVGYYFMTIIVTVGLAIVFIAKRIADYMKDKQIKKSFI